MAPGETVALVGPSGSGKSTVSLLLPRFYEVQAGSVALDGVDVRDVTLDSLRRQIGVVFEESFLFSDTVRANIAYGRPEATDDEVVAAARAAEAHEFVAALPEGYDTRLGEGGLTLSGGQRQRLALARALLTDPRVLVLDDATSAIDARIEEEIHATLHRLMQGRTTLLVAHRRSTLRLADRIAVVDGGSVVDTGTHEELLVRCRLYRLLLAGPGEGIEEAATEESDAGAQPPGGVTPSAWTADRARASGPGAGLDRGRLVGRRRRRWPERTATAWPWCRPRPSCWRPWTPFRPRSTGPRSTWRRSRAPTPPSASRASSGRTGCRWPSAWPSSSSTPWPPWPAPPWCAPASTAAWWPGRTGRCGPRPARSPPSSSPTGSSSGPSSATRAGRPSACCSRCASGSSPTCNGWGSTTTSGRWRGGS